MTNNTTKGVKKSSFIGSTSVPADAYFDYVSGGTNVRIKASDFYTSLGVSGTIVQIGDPLGAPVLDKQGNVNGIRNITAGFGISSAINALNGITFSTSFKFDDTGLMLVNDPLAADPVFKSLVGGKNISLASVSDTIEIDTNFTFDETGAALTDDPAVDAVNFRSLVAGNGISIAQSLGQIQITAVDGVASNSVIVSQESDFPTAVAGVITLAANTTYELVNNVSTSSRFIMQDNTVVQANGRLNTSLTYTGTGAMFTWGDASISINWITINCATGTLFNGVNSTVNTYGVDLDRVTFITNILGALGEFSACQVASCTFVSAAGGLTFSGDLGYLVIDSCVFSTAVGTALNLGTSTVSGLSILNTVSLGGAGATFLDGAANSGNVNTGGIATMSNCRNGSPTPLSANITTNDSFWQFSLNDKIMDTRPDGLLSLQGNAVATVIAVAGVPELVEGAWVVEDVSQAVGTTDGRITYLGGKNVKWPISAVLTVAPDAGGDRVLSSYIAINGVIVANSKQSTTAGSGKGASLSLSWQMTASTNDFVEVFVANEDNTTSVLVSSCILRIN